MILVTGANGFLGSYICRRLHAEKIPFIAMVRPSADLSLLGDILAEITIHHGDVCDPHSLEEVLDQTQKIIHCAATVSYDRRDWETMDAVNVGGTRNIVDLALAKGIKYLVHISSIAALGRSKVEGPVAEDNKWENSRWNTRYAQSKYRAELEVWRGIMEGLEAVILNPSVILGPGDWNKSSTRLFKYVWDQNAFYTDGFLNYIDVRDVADIVLKILEKEISGERYILNAGTVEYRDFFKQIADNFNKRAPWIKATPPLIRLALWGDTLKSFVSGKRPIITRETAKVSKNKIYFDNSKIKNALNHTFVPLSQTIAWTCDCFLREETK